MDLEYSADRAIELEHRTDWRSAEEGAQFKWYQTFMVRGPAGSVSFHVSVGEHGYDEETGGVRMVAQEGGVAIERFDPEEVVDVDETMVPEELRKALLYRIAQPGGMEALWTFLDHVYRVEFNVRDPELADLRAQVERLRGAVQVYAAGERERTRERERAEAHELEGFEREGLTVERVDYRDATEALRFEPGTVGPDGPGVRLGATSGRLSLKALRAYLATFEGFMDEPTRRENDELIRFLELVYEPEATP